MLKITPPKKYRRRRLKRPGAGAVERLGGSSHPATKPTDKRKRRLGVHSAIIDRGALGSEISGNLREGKFLRTYEKLLTEHVGGQPTVTQKLMILRTARLALHLELLDEQVFADGRVVGQFSYNHYCAWSNALSRMLLALGLKPENVEPANVSQLAQYLSQEAAE
jgi:hypothetical protein